MPFLNYLKNPRARRKVFRISLIAIIAAFLVFYMDFRCRQEWYLLEPNADPTGMRDSKLEDVKFELSPVEIHEDTDAVIHYRKYATTSNRFKGTVFYLHGNKGNMDKCEWEIEFLVESGYDVWTMDYRGYGESTGKISEEALIKDAVAVFEMINTNVGLEPVIIWGRSFGSGVAASVAAAPHNQSAKMLVLETPYWSLVDLTQTKCAILPSFLFKYELPTHKYLLESNCPIHLIHGTLDEKIPFSSSERLLNHCRINSIQATGHPIMCGVHNLREEATLAEFKEIAARILK